MHAALIRTRKCQCEHPALTRIVCLELLKVSMQRSVAGKVIIAQSALDGSAREITNIAYHHKEPARSKGTDSTNLSKAKSVHALKGLGVAGDLACVPRLRQSQSYLHQLL